MKHLLPVLVLLVSCASKPKLDQPNPTNRITIAEVLAMGHETGCKDGFMVVWEMGGYTRPGEYKDAYEAWDEIKKGCNFKNMLYRADLEDAIKIKE